MLIRSAIISLYVLGPRLLSFDLILVIGIRVSESFDGKRLILLNDFIIDSQTNAFNSARRAYTSSYAFACRCSHGRFYIVFITLHDSDHHIMNGVISILY